MYTLHCTLVLYIYTVYCVYRHIVEFRHIHTACVTHFRLADRLDDQSIDISWYIPVANHGAGIFTKTGPFCSGKCRCAYSSTMVRIWVSWYIHLVNGLGDQIVQFPVRIQLPDFLFVFPAGKRCLLHKKRWGLCFWVSLLGMSSPDHTEYFLLLGGGRSFGLISYPLVWYLTLW